MSGIYVKKLYLADRVHVHSNAWLYNILLIFQAVFFNLFFEKILNKYRNCKPVILSGFAVLMILYAYELYTHGIFEYNNLTNTVMSVLMVLYSLFFYFNLLNDDGYADLKFLPSFWWVSGILFFYFGATACNLFYEKLKPVFMLHQGYLRNIYSVLNIILYGCWCYSFICRKWLTTKSPAI